VDKRFGENDPRMAPEEKMLERFTREKQLRHKNSSAFDLEDDDAPGELTHMGQSLSLDGPVLRDDYEEEDMELSDAEDHPSDEKRQSRKRPRSDGEEDSEDDGDEADRPERKKSKQEVMKEVITKSKLHKYERQAAKDDDEDLREELDKELPNIHELLRGITRPKPAVVAEALGMNPDRAALLSGTEKAKFDKEYDMQVKKLTQDKRSKPTERTKPEDERIAEESRKLQELEAKRLRRMQGAPESSDEDEVEEKGVEEDDLDAEEDEFGLGSGIKAKPGKQARPTMAELGIDDEDDFLIDDDLVACGSEQPSDDESNEESGEENEEEEDEDENNDFLKGLLTAEESKRPEFLTGANAPIQEIDLPEENGVNGDLAYTFKCPESHEELRQIFKRVALLDLPTAIQRVRALYHPKLNAENKEKLGNFAVALVDHISYLANQPARPPFSILETLIRHVHSLAKTYPVEISNSFRSHLEEMQESRALAPTAGDLVIFTAIGTIFPTSDHFHQVVTPAILGMGRYLGQKIPQSLSDYTLGAYLCTLCLQYQKMSKRYVPELISFAENTLCALAPVKMARLPGSFPYHEPKQSIRIEDNSVSPRKASFYDCVSGDVSAEEAESAKVALLVTNLSILDVAADLWTTKAAFNEVFESASKILQHLGSKKCRSALSEATLVCPTHLPIST
jgi:nucleolar protein 14